VQRKDNLASWIPWMVWPRALIRRNPEHADVYCDTLIADENPTMCNNIHGVCSLVYRLILSKTININVSLGALTTGTEAANHPISEVLKSSKIWPDGKENQT
jgi:hypothetical protein